MSSEGPKRIRCECESIVCKENHTEFDCKAEGSAKNVTIMGTKLCDGCCSHMPREFMRCKVCGQDDVVGHHCTKRS